MAEADKPDVADCEQVLVDVYTYLDGELTSEWHAAITRHLEGCPDCVEVYDFEAELKMIISAKCREEPPRDLQERIARLIAGEGDGR